jgi:hypothetical protein
MTFRWGSVTAREAENPSTQALLQGKSISGRRHTQALARDCVLMHTVEEYRVLADDQSSRTMYCRVLGSL